MPTGLDVEARNDELARTHPIDDYYERSPLPIRWIERKRGGRIIHLSSVMGFAGNPVHKAVGYATSKGALNNLTRHLAIEWAQYGICVNALAPAGLMSKMMLSLPAGLAPTGGATPAETLSRAFPKSLVNLPALVTGVT